MTDLEDALQSIREDRAVRAAMGQARLEALTEDANRTLDMAMSRADKPVVAIIGLFSGGNDSTTMAHLFRRRVTHFAHANTSIGIEQTRQYVRDTCKSWGVPLIEKRPEPGKTYEDLVLGRVKPGPRGKKDRVWPGGFPGPAQHGMFYQRLKERALAAGLPGVRPEHCTWNWKGQGSCPSGLCNN